MTVLRFDIRHADGRAESLLLDADRVLIGNGAHCEIRLPLDQAAVEHVLIEAPGGVVRAQARAFDPQATINGIPFTEAPLPPDAVLAVGRTEMRVAPSAVSQGDKVVRAKKQKTSPLTYVLVAVALPLAGYVILADDSGDANAAPPPQAPELWGPPVTACPQADPGKAQAFAREKRVVADGKRERRPFHVQDGVQAVPLFETAAACFRAGGATDDAGDAQAAADQLRQQVNDDYRTHRVRLEHAVSVDDWRTSQHEVRILLAFTEGKQGDYVTWLSNLDRRLRLQHGRE
jgi:hypothetical protein